MSRVSRAAECGMNLAPSPRRAGRGAAAASAGSPSSSPSGATAPPRSFFMSSSLHRRRPRQGAHARVSTPAARRAHGTLTRAPTRSHSAQPDTHHEDTRDVALSSTSICGLALFLPRCTIASTRHRTCLGADNLYFNHWCGSASMERRSPPASAPGGAGRGHGESKRPASLGA